LGPALILVAFGRRFCVTNAQKLAISALTLYRLGSLRAKIKAPKTQAQQPNNKMSRVPPYKSGFALSLTMGTGYSPRIIAPPLPYK
jgi:hypothetical protein